jgi:hypothetical protein
MCEVAAGYDRVCDNTGGVKRWYWFSTFNAQGQSNYSATPVVANGAVASLSLNSGVYAYALNVEMETSTFTDTRIGERTNKAYGREQSATIVLHGNTAEMIANIDAAAKGRVTVIAELEDGTYEVLFLENGGLITDERTPGTAYEDMNGNTLTITGKEKAKAPKISESLVLALLEPVS